MGFTLQPAARRDLVDVAVNVDLQQRARMIGWTSGRFWNHTVKAQRPEIQLIDKHVDHPHRVVLSNVVIQILGKQNALYTVFTLNEARHLTPWRESSRIITQQAFSHSLHPVAAAFLAERRDLLGKVFRARAAARSAFRDIALVEPPQIVVQPLVGRADELLQRGSREIAIRFLEVSGVRFTEWSRR